MWGTRKKGFCAHGGPRWISDIRGSIMDRDVLNRDGAAKVVCPSPWRRARRRKGSSGPDSKETKLKPTVHPNQEAPINGMTYPGPHTVRYSAPPSHFLHSPTDMLTRASTQSDAETIHAVAIASLTVCEGDDHSVSIKTGGTGAKYNGH